MVPVTVNAPPTKTLPAISTSALASIFPSKVEIPVTYNCLKVPIPAGGRAPFAPIYL